MKNLIFTCLTVLTLFIFVPRVLAVPATPSADQKTQELLDRVATKVAELADQTRRTYHGTIKSLGTSSLIVSTDDGDKTVAVNSATSFFRIRAGSRSETDLKGLKVGDYITAVGTIDPSSGDMTTKQIIAKIHRTNLTGTIQSITKGVATINSTDIDLTDASLKTLTRDNKIVAAKLSDFTSGNQIFAIAFSSDPKSATLSALKSLTLTK